MLGALIFLLVAGLFVVGVIVAIQMLTLPGDVRGLREVQASLQRELRTLSTRVDGLRTRLDRLEGGVALDTPSVSIPLPQTPQEDELEPYEPESEIDESVARFLARSGTTPVDTPASSRTQPPALDLQVEDALAQIRAESKSVYAASTFNFQSPPPLPSEAPARTTAPSRSAPEESGLGRWLKSLGPKDKNMTWEMALGTYWLPRLGALAVTTAVVFALTLAFQKWGPPLRVAVGYAVSAGLLGLGWRFDRKYPAYARVLFGAGFALTYFVTFATHFVPFARVLESPQLSLAGLAAIVIAWAALAQRRGSPIIAGVAVAMGHFTIALSTYSMPSPGPYTVAGIVFISIGGAFFLARNGWYAVAALGLLASYANHFYLMTKIETTGTRLEFATGMGVLCTYFLVYALAELAAPEELRRKRLPLWFRNGFVTVNSVCLLLLGTIAMFGYDFTKGNYEIFYYALAAALLAISILYLRLRDGDPLHNAYFAKGVTVATLGLATQYDAHTLSASLAIECAVLLYAARRNGLLVSRVLALAAGVLAFAHTLFTIANSETIPYDASDFVPRLVEAAAIVLAFFTASQIYQRTRWQSPECPSWLSAEIAISLWQLDLLASLPIGRRPVAKPVGGLLISGAFSVIAGVLTACYANELAASVDRALAIVAAAVVVTVAALLLRATPFAVAALLLMASGTLAASMQLLDAMNDIQGGPIEAPLDRIVPILIGVALVALASEKRYFGAFAGLAPHQDRRVSFALYAAFAWLLGLHLDGSMQTPASNVGALVLAAAALAIAAIPLNRAALAYCATALLAWAALRWPIEWSTGADRAFLATAWAAIAAALAGERYFARLGLRYAGPLCMAIATFLFTAFVRCEATGRWEAFWWTLGAATLLAHGALLRGRTAAGLGVALLTLASLHHATATGHGTPGTWAIIAGFAAPAACWIALERAVTRYAAAAGVGARRAPLQALCAGIATALLTLMLYRLPQLAEYYLTISWSLLGMGLFGLAVGLGEKLYRYCGLAVLALAGLRVIAVDTRELDTVEKVLAYGVLGIILLALGFGYVRVFARAQQPGAEQEEKR